jgi:5-methylcytosine-specific restriction endonuclease McrA
LFDPPPRAVLEPIAPRRYKVSFTVGQSTRDTLQRIQALLRHQIPDGDLAAIFDRALTGLHDELMKRKFAVTDRPRSKAAPPTEFADSCAPASKPGSRYIPNEVRRRVLERDGMQCTFVSADGIRCGERGFLEFHHGTPFARGGEATAENVRLLCKAHNAYEAENEFGAAACRPSRARERQAPYGLAAVAHSETTCSEGSPANWAGPAPALRTARAGCARSPGRSEPACPGDSPQDDTAAPQSQPALTLAAAGCGAACGPLQAALAGDDVNGAICGWRSETSAALGRR